MSIDQEKGISRDSIEHLKMIQLFRTTLPIFILPFTPITVGYTSEFEPTFSVFFLLGSINFGHFVPVIIFDRAADLFFSVPALIASIVSAWALRRLSDRKTTPRNALRAIVGVTIIWAACLSIVFFIWLALGRLLVGPFPVPLGPIAAVLSRGYLVRLSEQIDELERPVEGLTGQ